MRNMPKMPDAKPRSMPERMPMKKSAGARMMKGAKKCPTCGRPMPMKSGEMGGEM